ncbi:MAG: epoxyqueuosine reductase [Chloroflexota bacterium]
MKAWIEHEIAATVAEAQAREGSVTRWRAPLVAYASAEDPLFPQLKQIVRATHATPQELLPGARSVIAWFLPFEREVPRSNRPHRHASESWAVAYVETNALIREVGGRLTDGLRARGFDGAGTPPTHNFDKEMLMSDWSHKHVAYIAGLGRFGLHQMLITASGSAGRLGSLVTTAPLEATQRSDQPACLHTLDGSCTACMDNCPVGALTPDGYDRHACYALCLENADKHQGHGLADVCGKCVSVVPCTYLDPVARRLARPAAAAAPASTGG